MKEFLIHRGSIDIAAALFEVEYPAYCLQIVHGAKEHKERYYPFARWLQDLNIAVIISDHRGHGASVSRDYPLGHMNGFKELVDDMYCVTKYIKQIYPGVPLAVLGHSFGSVLARCYLEKHDEEISALVLSGTANYVPAVEFGIFLGTIITCLSGDKGHNKLLMKLGDGNDDSWVCQNPEVIENYRADPLCSGYKYTNKSVMTIWTSDRELHKFKNYDKKNPNLRILSVSGELDPVTGGEKGLQDSMLSLRKLGYADTSYKIYPGMKHEVLNETDKMTVWRDIYLWLVNDKSSKK